ncbi:hypothetical protein ACIGXM_31820 [Kitasatospora sp. NPDC052896]|uniref:hypothetical protein n=1 Tax=Kitasatospora sp. NPDC052896 TaxID=3364061 RepID=UPI0037CB9E02
MLVVSLAACGGGARSAGAAVTSAAPRMTAAATATASGSENAGRWRLTAMPTLPGGYTISVITTSEVDPDHRSKPAPIGRIDDALEVGYSSQAENAGLDVDGYWGSFNDPGAILANSASHGIDAKHIWAQPFTVRDAEDPHDTDGKLGCGLESDTTFAQ